MTRNRADVRSAAESIYSTVNMYRHYPNLDHIVGGRSQSINLITEDFLAGYMQDGRMSVVRRFFCLFVTFDLFFISLLWLICIMVTGANIYDALKIQVVHYTIYTSLFDIVVAAICRFIVLLLFYAILYINHWIVIALSTSGSCAFLISKVFVYDWIDTPQPVFQVVLILTSFILAWGEAWFLDCRVIPQERHANSYFPAFTPQGGDRTPLVAPFLAAESIGNFYSPYESVHNSDDENDEQAEEYKKMGIECVRRACTLLDSSDWKVEKITPDSDTIRATRKDKLGKILRLTGRIRYPARLLLEELFYNIEQMPKWNTSLLESKILKKIDNHTDITYQAAKGGGQGMVSCRDFVNLRCWQVCRNGKIVDPSEALFIQTMPLFTSSNSEADVSNDGHSREVQTTLQRASSEVKLPDSVDCERQDSTAPAFRSLSKSLGAHDFQSDEEVFEDACDKLKSSSTVVEDEGAVYVSAAVSIDFPNAPTSTKFIRGENLVSCWAMREIAGKPDCCIFEWLLCVDLKGYIPRYVLDAAFLTQMQLYMTQLRAHCAELRKEKVPIEV